MADTLGIILRLLLDRSSQQEVKKGLDDSAKSIEVLDSRGRTWKKTAEGLVREYQHLGRTQTQLIRSVENLIKRGYDHGQAVKRNSEEMKQNGFEVGKTTQKIKEQNTALDQNVKSLNASSRAVSKMVQASASIGRTSQGLFFTGSAILTGMFLAANKEAQRIKEAGGVVDATTQKWLESQRRIELSYQRIGQTAMQALLPMLEKVAALAERGSKFVEANPQIVQAALNTGMVVATVGAVGMLVSKGIRFVADATLIAAQVKYGLSTLMFKSSVDKFLLAVTAQKGLGAGGLAGKGATLAGGAGALGVAGTVAASTLLVVGGIIASGVAVAMVNELLEKTGISRKIEEAQAEIRERDARVYPMFVNDPKQREAQVALNKAIEKGDAEEIKRLKEEVEKAGIAAKDTKKSLWETIQELLGLNAALDDVSESADQAGFDILRNLERENLQAEQKYIEQRATIIARSNQAIQQASAQLASQLSAIRSRLKESLANLSEAFSRDNLKAYQDFKLQEARIIRDGEQEILKIRENAAEQLRKLQEQFAVQENELTRQRDALGLVKARREFERQKREIQDNADKEVAERRRQQAQALADLRASYERERAERFAKYQQDMADAKAQASIQEAEAKATAARQIAELRRQKALELQELAKSYHEERRQRILDAQAKLQELGNAQNAERILRQRYYAEILTDANNFMRAYQNSLRAGRTPSRQAGGYSEGTMPHLLHAGEYVLNPRTTRALEGLIGGRLTQESILNSATSKSIVFQDNRRFDSRISPEERRAIAAEWKRDLREFAMMIGGS